MKSYRTKLFAMILLVGIFSCSDDQLRLDDLAQLRDSRESMNDPFLLSSIITKTSIFYQNRGWGETKLPGAVQYTVRNYQGGDNYYTGFKTGSDDMYAAMDILKLIDGSIRLATERDSKTHVGIFTTYRVLLFSFITDYYGDVYYTEALKGREGILNPIYDSQEKIYDGLLAELEAANTMIKSGTDVVNPTYDLMFGGDKVQWEKFCNSLRLRLLIHGSAKIANVGSKLSAVAALPLLSTNEDKNASIAYVGTNPNNSWIGGGANWGANSSSGEFEKRRPCKTLVDKLASLNDPRMKVWFAPISNPWTDDPAKNGQTVNTTDPNGYNYTSKWEYVDVTKPEINAQVANILDKDKLYAGFIAGMNGDFKNGNGHYNTADGGAYGNFKVSMYSTLFKQNAHALLKAQIMNKDEIQFSLAEAAAKGLIAGDANAYYKKGIEFSMKRWGINDADITAYLAQSSIALPGDTPGKLAMIAEQKWIALFSVATESYLELRRTQLPNIFSNGNLGTYNFPLRYRYPGDELGQNKSAYDAGVATLSPPSDTETSKTWLLQ